LFAHRDGVEATWALYTPVLEEWTKLKPRDFPNYKAGSWGPKASDGLIGRDGRQWHRI
jgi:glucose-6-phosphate 1-dehydrogenase